jgi:hypothetical protein
MAAPHPAKLDGAGVEALRRRLLSGRQLWDDNHRWPGAELPIRVRVLGRGDRQLVLADARARMAELGFDPANLSIDDREEYATEQATQILSRAICHRPVDPRTGEPCDVEAGRELVEFVPVFTADEWRDAVDNAETEALLALYSAAERDSDPTVVELADIEPAIFALVEEAQKKSAPELLRGIDICTLRSLLVSTEGPRRPSTSSRSGSSSSGATPAPPPSPTR